jgi:hypothetical protein
MIFTQQEKQDMIHAAYVVEELADAVEFMPIAPSQEALAQMYGDVCPSGPTPPAPDYKKIGEHADYAAGYSTQMHLAFGREAVVAYNAQMEADLEECEGHPDDGQFNGPMGETFYCDGSCRSAS